MLESPAYRVLSLSAHRILDRLEIELAHHGGTDNGKLPCTYDDFVAHGIDRHAIAPAIRELVALGFVEVTEKGRAGNAEFRSPNKYRLTYRHVGRLPEPTDEWRRIDTLALAAEIAKAARGQKPKPSEGISRNSVRETHTEKPIPPVSGIHTTPPVGLSPLLSTSRGHQRDSEQDDAVQTVRRCNGRR